MSQMFGERNCLAFDVGEASEPTGNLRRVDMWADEKHLTYFDNSVYVPQFLGDIEHAIRWLRSDPDLQFPFPELSPVETHKRLCSIDDRLREYYWFFQWGPTTDGFSSLIFRSAEQVHLTFEVRQEIHPYPTTGDIGEIFAVTLPEQDLLTILEQTAAALKIVPTPERTYPNQINPDQVKL